MNVLTREAEGDFDYRGGNMIPERDHEQNKNKNKQTKKNTGIPEVRKEKKTDFLVTLQREPAL